MARFVSRSQKYKHGARVGREMVLADGQRQTIETFLQAVFTPAANILTEDEIQFGIQNLNHLGLPIDKNTNSHVSPRVRLSGYDSVEAQKANGWTDEEREIVEKALRESVDYGTDFIELPAAQVSKPWATYEDTPVAQIVSLALAVGVSLEDVLAYEKQNRNSEVVVNFLTEELALATPDAETSPVVIEA